MALRDDILSAVVEAKRLHRKHDTQARAKRGEGRVDVFQMFMDQDILVMFRPLGNLLGAYVSEPDQGVMVTTKRALPVQRFTAAHELGHYALQHETSLDEEAVLSGALFNRSTSYDTREIQANAFATELLTPSWLIAEHMRRQGWKNAQLSDAAIVYQLALRMGSSYTATCYALFDCKAIRQHTFDLLMQSKPKTIKQTLAAPYEPANWRGDVWVITERDQGMVLEGGRRDLVVLKFNEHASSGYVWQLGELVKAGFAVKTDGRTTSSTQNIGGIVLRTVVSEPVEDDGVSAKILFRETRPWQASGQPLNSLELNVDLNGPVKAGLHPAQLEALLKAA